MLERYHRDKMDAFRQQKLTRSEWNSIEKPVDEKEKTILKLIKNGLTERGKVYLFNTINDVVHLDHAEKDYYIYFHLLKELIDPIIQTYGLVMVPIVAPKKKLNAGDTIRLSNQKKKLTENIETTIIQLLLLFFKDSQKKKCELYFYNICYLISTYTINKYLGVIVADFIEKYKPKMDIINFFENVDRFIETNPIFDYKPLELYDHQVQVFDIFKTQPTDPTLLFYRAPTSSGKTQTPLGLCSHYKVIFMCASRHIGISLGKNAVNAGVKVGFALGCETADDVRLHFSAVNTYKTFTRPDKSVGNKPDHTNGLKVEMLICDIQSYEIAMLYMTSFFDINTIITVMDEPTITMDYAEHELHQHISKIWEVNVIKHIIFSSATLPNEEELLPMIEKFKCRFQGAKVHYIETIDETTNISLLDNSGNVIMPHTIFKEPEQLAQFIEVNGKSHFKFLSVVECSIFIMYVCKNVFKNIKMISEYFKSVDKINTQTIRNYYYYIIKKIKKDELDFIIQSYSSFRELKTFDVGIDITTKNSYTLTYGPTIFLCRDIQVWVNYFIENSGIHFSIYDQLEKSISFNNDLFDKISKKRMMLEDRTAKDQENENKMKDQRFDPETKRLISEIEALERTFKPLKLNNVDIPNTREHFMRWTNKKYEDSNAFTSNIDAEYVKRIMSLTIDNKHKILLLMGIGIFNPEEKMGDYNDIMKELAEQKYLMCIIASSDYIYGTNYQFCHAYLTEDMTEYMTQEKIIQAIGRVGRRDKNKKFTFRFKNDEMVQKLFIKNNTVESDNMNKLFF